MTLRKLEKSLLLKVEQRLQQLIPDAEVRSTRRSLRIRWNELDCEITVQALAEACMHEDRGSWGAIAGSFCHLVAARVHAFFGEPLSREVDLERVYPSLVADDAVEDALLAAAAPTPALAIAGFPWLDSFRVEFDYRGPGAHRRVFIRDIDTIGTSVETVFQRARQNLDQLAPDLPFEAVGEQTGDAVVLVCRSDSFAPTLLATETGQKAILAALGAALATNSRALACAPRSDRLYVCSMRSKGAMSRLCAAAWRDFETDEVDSLPLSPRLFTVSDQPQVKLLDPGQPAERFPEWRVTAVGSVQFAVPDAWQVSQQGDRWVIWTSAEGPRVRIRNAQGRGGSPLAGYELAERMRQKHRPARDARGEPDVELGHGFFNGLPWTSVDTGLHEGCTTASLFVVLDREIVVLQTEIPTGCQASEQMALQKIMSTIHPVPPPPLPEGDEL